MDSRPGGQWDRDAPLSGSCSRSAGLDLRAWASVSPPLAYPLLLHRELCASDSDGSGLCMRFPGATVTNQHKLTSSQIHIYYVTALGVRKPKWVSLG